MPPQGRHVPPQGRDMCLQGRDMQMPVSDDDRNLHDIESDQNTVLQDEQVLLSYNLEFSALAATMKVISSIKAQGLTKVFPSNKCHYDAVFYLFFQKQKLTPPRDGPSCS